MGAIFATVSDMLARFAESELVQLTDDAGTGTIDMTRMDQALASASAYVGGYVSSTYRLDPDQPVPLLLVDAACDVARFRLYRQTPPEDVVTRNSQATRTLQSIRAGSIKLDEGVETIEPRGGKIILQAGEREMSRPQMKGW